MAAEESAPKQRVVGRPFEKGKSGNPKGRPKGTGTAALANALKAKVTDLEYVEWLLGVWRGEIKPTREQMWASDTVGERIWGKAPSFAPIEDGDPLGLAESDGADSFTTRVLRLVDSEAAAEPASRNGRKSRSR